VIALSSSSTYPCMFLDRVMHAMMTTMDPSHISPSNSEDEDATAMAAFMGFSAFGSHKPPTKKRKFNPTTDAFVEGQGLEKLDRGGKKGMGSGGNTMPLGKVRVIGEVKSSRGNEDKIPLDLDEVEDGGELGDEHAPKYEDTILPAPTNKGTEEAEDDGPAYLDTSEISPQEAAEIQARKDTVLALIGSNPEGDVDAPDYSTKNTSTLPPPPHGLPQRPAFTATSDTEFMQGGSRGRTLSDAMSTSSRGGRGRGRGGGGGRERGERNEKWYEDYYDPTFNENPWARLEKEKGLRSVGTWLENQRRRVDGRGNELKA
jgi:hypothetical protein